MQHVLDIIKKAHPELEQRLITAPLPEYPYTKYDADYGITEEVVGMRKEDFHTLEEVFLLSGCSSNS